VVRPHFLAEVVHLDAGRFWKEAKTRLRVTRGSFLTSPQGVNLGSNLSLGGMFTPLFTPEVNTLCCLEEWRGEQIISSHPEDNIHPWGQSLPKGPKFRMDHRMCQRTSIVRMYKNWLFYIQIKVLWKYELGYNLESFLEDIGLQLVSLPGMLLRNLYVPNV
jgi:hypothetical protein